MSSIKIFTQSHEPADGGPFISLRSMVDLLRLHQFEVDLIIYNNFFKNLRINKKDICFKKFLHRIKKFFDRSSIYYFNGFWSFGHLVMVIILGILDRKIVIQPRGMLMNHSMKKNYFFKKIFLLMFRVFVKKKITFLFSSNLERNSTGPLLNSIKCDYEIVPNFIEFDELLLESQYRKALEPNDFINYLCVSRPDSLKGLDIALSAWMERPERDDVNLNVLGVGRSELKGLVDDKLCVKALNRKDIVFHGFQTGIAKQRVFEASDILLHFSKGENFGVAIAEALFKGLKVLTNDLNPWHEYGLDRFVEVVADERPVNIASNMRNIEMEHLRCKHRQAFEMQVWMDRVGLEIVELFRRRFDAI